MEEENSACGTKFCDSSEETELLMQSPPPTNALLQEVGHPRFHFSSLTSSTNSQVGEGDQVEIGGWYPPLNHSPRL